jgi:hypothetical protein
LLVILNGGENFYGGGSWDTWNKNNDKRHHIHFVSSTPINLTIIYGFLET